jgi:hypothetical protein
MRSPRFETRSASVSQGLPAARPLRSSSTASQKQTTSPLSFGTGYYCSSTWSMWSTRRLLRPTARQRGTPAMRATRGRSIQHPSTRPDASLIQLCITEADRHDWNCDKCNSRSALSEAQIRAARAVERSSKAKLGLDTTQIENSHLCCSATILTDLHPKLGFKKR